MEAGRLKHDAGSLALPAARLPDAMKSRLLSQWIDCRLSERPPRANSLIITIYGDMIAPHGGAVWLRAFIGLVEPLGLNERMVRTSVFRLSRERWLISQQIGRRSFYSLTETGRRRFEQAYRRIYDDARVAWDGEWRIVLAPSDGLSPAGRDALRKELLWEGYGAIAPGVFAHPSARSDRLIEILQTSGAHDRVVALQARTLGALSSKPLKDIVDQCWSLGKVAAEYHAFIETFRPVARALRGARHADPGQCFLVRALLMHEFRRVQLRDPLLPRQLLPADWPGDLARELCRDIYATCWRPSEAHLSSSLETADGPLPPGADSIQSRFAGLEGAAEDAA